MNREQYKKYIAQMHEGLMDAAQDDPEMDPADIVYEVADSALSFDDEGKKAAEYLKSQGVVDITGRLADDIYSGVC